MGLQIPCCIHSEAQEKGNTWHVAQSSWGDIPGTGIATFVSTVGLNEEMVRAYIRNQELEDERYDQMKLGL
jgi:hypothetical protein